MKTNFTEYPVIDPKPDFSKVVDNIKTADIASHVPILATLGYFWEPNPAMKGRTMVLSGLWGVVSGHHYAFMASYGRLTGLFKNDDEVAKYNKK